MASTVTGVLLTGNHAGRPSSGVTAGTLYSCTTHSLIYQTSDTGSTWATWATLGTAGGSGTLTTVKDEGSNLSTAVVSLDFVGAGVTATGTTAVTVTIPGGGDLAGKELDYVQITSPVSPTHTSEATADTVVTGSSVAYDGSTVVMIEFWTDWASPDASGAHDLRFWLYDNGSSIGFMGYVQSMTDGGQAQYRPVHLMRRITPSNASHTYSIRASVDGGTGSIHAGAGGSGAEPPAFIRITRVTS